MTTGREIDRVVNLSMHLAPPCFIHPFNVVCLCHTCTRRGTQDTVPVYFCHTFARRRTQLRGPGISPHGGGLKMNQMECRQAVAGGCALATGTAICLAGISLGAQHALSCAVVVGAAQVADGTCYLPPTEHEFQNDGKFCQLYATV